MNPKLSVDIGADISKLEKALINADQLLKQHESNYSRVSNTINKNNGKVRILESSLEQLNKEFKNGSISQTDYDKESKRLTTTLTRTQRETKAYAVELDRLEGEIRQVQQQSSRYSSQLGGADKATAQLGKTTQVNAVPALTSFSQVIQDAPYGIRGVANNITQLTSQFGYLSQSTGGAMGALKALGGSLLGPAGILFGVSLVTSALVTYGDQIFSAVGATNKLKEATQDYLGEANAEISDLQVLIAIASDHEASIVARRKALEQINDKYGDYLGNLSLDELQTDKTRKAVDKLTRSLIQQAQVKGLKDVISEETTKAAEKTTDLQLKQRDAYKDIRKELKAMDQTGYWGLLIKDSNDVLGTLNAISKQQANWPVGLKTAVGGYQEITQELKDIEKETANAIKPYQELQKALQEQIFSVTAVPEFDQDAVEITGNKPAPVKVPVELDLPRNMMDAAGVEELLNTIANDDALGNALADANYLSGLNQAEENFFATSEENWQEHTDKIKEFSDQQRMQAQLLAQAFSSMANQLIDGLVEGQMSMADFVKSTVKMVGKMLVSIAAQAIANSVLSATQTAAASGPAAALVLPGLLGATVSATKGALPAFAEGGIVGGNSLYGDKILARLNSKELILNTDQQKELYGQLQSPNMIMSTPNEPVEITGETFISGDKIRVIYKRAGDNRGRVS